MGKVCNGRYHTSAVIAGHFRPYWMANDHMLSAMTTIDARVVLEHPERIESTPEVSRVDPPVRTTPAPLSEPPWKRSLYLFLASAFTMGLAT